MLIFACQGFLPGGHEEYYKKHGIEADVSSFFPGQLLPGQFISMNAYFCLSGAFPPMSEISTKVPCGDKLEKARLQGGVEIIILDRGLVVDWFGHQAIKFFMEPPTFLVIK